MLQWFFKNYFSWAYLQLAAHKLMTCLGLSKSDWFGYSCKDQHDVWSRTDPPINFQSVSPLHVCGRSLQKRHCGALWLYSPPVTITRKDSQHAETRPLGPSSMKAATFSNPTITCPTCGVCSVLHSEPGKQDVFLHQFLLLSSSSGT